MAHQQYPQNGSGPDPPKIPYRETITKMAASSYRHKKQSGGAGQFGEVHLLIEPYVEGAPENNRFKVEGKELVLNLKVVKSTIWTGAEN